MSAAISVGELKAFQNRLAALERQLQLVQSSINNGSAVRPAAPNGQTLRTITDEEFHRYNLEVQAIIEKNRAADRKRSIAEYDRLHGAKKKSARQKVGASSKRTR